jgi:hypothetical protein
MAHDSVPTRLLIRTTAITPAVLEFADTLERTSNYPVALIFDERAESIDSGSRTAIGLSTASCTALGLYCPEDFAWKCGDYGYYLARERFPDTEHFWMVETDVRFYGNTIADFFRFFDGHVDVDFLAADIGPAGHSWFWLRSARARDVTPYRCLFPVTRLSRRAIDAVLERRLSHGRYLRRRLLWPNDEAMVATTLLNSGFACRDFNDFGRAFYSEETFYYGEPIDGDNFQVMDRNVQMVHPILFGATYAARLARNRPPEPRVAWLTRQLQNAAIKLNAASRW